MRGVGSTRAPPRPRRGRRAVGRRDGPGLRVGLAALAGSSPDVGVVGYTLGGGIGWLARRHGLCCNSVTAIELVTADGARCTVDAEQRARAVLGAARRHGQLRRRHGDGARADRPPELYAGAMLWPWERAAEVLHRWRAWTLDAPETVTTSARILQVPPLPDIPECCAAVSSSRSTAPCSVDAYADEVLAPLRALEPEIDMFAAAPPVGAEPPAHGSRAPGPGHRRPRAAERPDAGAIDALVDAAGPGPARRCGRSSCATSAARCAAAAGAGARSRIDAAYRLLRSRRADDAGAGTAIWPRCCSCGRDRAVEGRRRLPQLRRGPTDVSTASRARPPRVAGCQGQVRAATSSTPTTRSSRWPSSGERQISSFGRASLQTWRCAPASLLTGYRARRSSAALFSSSALRRRAWNSLSARRAAMRSSIAERT